MRSAPEYRNHSGRARAVARVLDLLASPLIGLPDSDVRRGCEQWPAKTDEHDEERRDAGDGRPGENRRTDPAGDRRPVADRRGDPVAHADEGRSAGKEESAGEEQTRQVREAGAARPRILLIRPDHAGDLLMATPAIRALRRAHPGSVIDLLASPWGAPAAARNPDIDRVLTIEASWFEPGRRAGPDPAGLLGALLSVRRGRYSAAADLRGDFRSILVARASGARLRAGFSRLGLEALLTECVPFDPALDHIARNHAVVRLLGAGPLGPRRPIFVVPDEARGEARRLLAGLPAGRPLVGVFPGTNRPSASWGAECFAETCRILARKRPVSFAIGGREADRYAAGRVAHAAAREGAVHAARHAAQAATAAVWYVGAAETGELGGDRRRRAHRRGAAIGGSGRAPTRAEGKLAAAADEWTDARRGAAESGPEPGEDRVTIRPRAGTTVLDLAGRTDFAQAAALIAACSVLLANDSGAAHLAVAVGTPVVSIFGPTDPATLWTWDGPERNVALAGPSSCARPCFRPSCGGDHGYRALAPADVADLLGRLLDLGREEESR